MLLTSVYISESGLSEDIQLWKYLLSGDRCALSQLFRKYYAPLLNYGLKLYPYEELVKDCIQELFYTIWEQRNRLSDVEYVRSYLYLSLRRTIYRLAKRQNARTERDYKYSEESFREMINQEDLMMLDELKQEQVNQLHQALEHLTIRQKEAIFLKFYNGLTNDEIAKVMDVNKQSVYNYISRAVESLRHLVKVH